jgi:phosphoglycerol transferase MdoB-like AlkP superfamily enzyme
MSAQYFVPCPESSRNCYKNLENCYNFSFCHLKQWIALLFALFAFLALLLMSFITYMKSDRLAKLLLGLVIVLAIIVITFLVATIVAAVLDKNDVAVMSR